MPGKSILEKQGRETSRTPQENQCTEKPHGLGEEGIKAMTGTPFATLADLCKKLEATTKRKEKTKLVSEFLKNLKPREVAPATLMIVGSIFPEFDSRTLEVGWKTLKKALEGGKQSTLLLRPLTIENIYDNLVQIAKASGTGSRQVKNRLLEVMINQANPTEVEYLVRMIFKEMRIGVNEGLMIGGIAKAADTDPKTVRRALMLTGNLGEIAKIALQEGEEGLKRIPMKIFVPLKPMLSSIPDDVGNAIENHGGKTAFEFKLDGARIQIHRKDNTVRIYSRRLSDVTESLPDIVKLVTNSTNQRNFVVEGEAVAIGEDEKPLPFQDLMRRFTRVHNVEEMADKIPLKLHLFDILYLEGRLLIDETYQERAKFLRSLFPENLIVESITTEDPEEARAFLKKALESGHEGLMAKRLDSKYTPGARGKAWYKIKLVKTLDLIILAADWGSGRRTGWLSNYHLAAKHQDSFMIIGKTFKGLTDEEFEGMTKTLKSLKTGETRHTVHVKPEIVVEVAFNEIQRSPHYKSGYALRFARITRIRTDKTPEDIDTIGKVRELFENQFQYKAKTGLI
jgi:DNA ligase-1